MAEGRFVAYYRVSTEKQGRSGLGLEAQRGAVEAFLNGGSWKLVAEFTEIESGKRDGPGRPWRRRRAVASDSAIDQTSKLPRIAPGQPEWLRPTNSPRTSCPSSFKSGRQAFRR